jgi:hypothetical protein
VAGSTITTYKIATGNAMNIDALANVSDTHTRIIKDATMFFDQYRDSVDAIASLSCALRIILSVRTSVRLFSIKALAQQAHSFISHNKHTPTHCIEYLWVYHGDRA